jgi:hypothetical protein
MASARPTALGRIREEIRAEHCWDVDRLFAAMHEKEKQYGDRLVGMVPRRDAENPTLSCAKNRRRPNDFLCAEGCRSLASPTSAPTGSFCKR